MINSRVIPASPAAVWEALNDPEALKASVPGCESLERVDDATYKATMLAKIGPVSARFAGTMRIAESSPPTAYTLRFEGQGGAAGFANGEARVTLAPADGGSTTLAYHVKAQVGGKLAQIGSRLVDAAAAKLADEFFARFTARLSPKVEATSEAQAVERGRAPDSAPWIRYVSLALVAAIVAYLAVRGFR
jgi:hypothetical protein